MIFHSFIIGIHGLTLYVKIFHSHRTVCLFTVFVGGSKPNTELILLSCLLVQLSVCLFVCLFVHVDDSLSPNQSIIDFEDEMTTSCSVMDWAIFMIQ